MNFLFPIVAQDGERHLSSRRIARNPIAERVGVAHRCIIDSGDDIALTYPRAFSGAALADRIHDDPFGFRHPKTLREIGRHPTHRNSKLATADFAVFHELIHNAAGHVRRNRKADSDIAAATGQNL